MNKKSGITIIEISIALMIMTLLGFIFYNTFNKTKPYREIDKASWGLLSELKMVQSRAFTSNERAYLRLVDGLLISEVDENGNGVIEGRERQMRSICTSESIEVERANGDKQMAFNAVGSFFNDGSKSAPSYEDFTISHKEISKKVVIRVLPQGGIQMKGKPSAPLVASPYNGQ